jgi:hypothetical protein
VRQRAMLHACDCGAAPGRDVGLRFRRSRHGRQTGLLRSPSRIARSHNPRASGRIASPNPEEMPNGADQLYRPGHRRRHRFWVARLTH